jgi:hypothetical protein
MTANIPKMPSEAEMDRIREMYVCSDEVKGVVYAPGTPKEGKVPGYIHTNKQGNYRYSYRRIGVCPPGGKARYIRASHIVWFLSTGEWPDQLIDHINQDPLDDRFENLRLVSHRENLMNLKKRSKYGYGVRKYGKKFRAQIFAGGKLQYLGMHPSAQEARDACDAVYFEHHPEALEAPNGMKR